ncbi:hypothetical protein BX666DRAFT_1880223 [Dichotomocladium elegans]|nr:hypothetical protein BX666DRAFT_1880223 [Dichotomocladium elegans]
MSEQLRHELLTRISQLLSRPEDNGDRFFAGIVRNAKDGFVPITILRNMVAEFSDIPAGYFEHIADKEPDRLEISIDRTRVRIPRQDDDYNRVETNPYGLEYTPPCEQEEQNFKLKQTTKKSLHFQPYTPRFNKKRLLHPVYYANGKFFADTEPEQQPRLDRPSMQVPPYYVPSVPPLGSSTLDATSRACWNCGKAGHSLEDCPEPRDPFSIREYKKKSNQKKYTFGRFFVELELRNKVASLTPGRLSDALQDALGMNELHPEPPYYPKMREQGYPPGYWGSPVAQDSIKRREAGLSEHLLFHYVPDLEIYTDLSTPDMGAQDQHEKTESKVKLVHYPGLENNAPQPYLPQQMQQQQQQQQYVYDESMQSWNAYFQSLTPDQQQQTYYYYYGYVPTMHQTADYSSTTRYQPSAPTPQPVPAYVEQNQYRTDDDMDISDDD